MKRTLLLAAFVTVFAAGCSAKHDYSEQELTCINWAGFASHQYSRYLEGEMQEGDLNRWANTHLDEPSRTGVLIVETAIPLVFHQPSLPRDSGVWAIGNSVKDVCMTQKWTPMTAK